MLQPHINVCNEQVAQRVIVCGDPDRAKRIATWCDDGIHITTNREFSVYRGYYCGKEITICSTGIGSPSAIIALEELLKCGAKYLIRVGSCGALQSNIALGDIVIAEAAVRDEGGSSSYLPLSYPAVSDLDLLQSLTKITSLHSQPFHTGIVRSHDSFYTDQELDICHYWHQRGVIAADMETSSLLAVGRYRGLKVASVLNTVVLYEQDVQEGVNDFKHDEKAMAAGEKQCALIALEALAEQKEC